MEMDVHPLVRKNQVGTVQGLELIPVQLHKNVVTLWLRSLLSNVMMGISYPAMVVQTNVRLLLF